MRPARSAAESVPAPPGRATTRLEKWDFALLAALILVFAVSRGAIFPYAQNLYGDSVARSEIADRWARSPHVIRSFDDDVRQFGPLHVYFMGAILRVWPAREHATRFASLLVGVLVAVPVYRLGKRLFSREAAVVAALALAAWGLHIQASTVASSEALFLFLFFFGLDALFQGIGEGRIAPLAVSALFANLFCATRYDGWLIVPLLGLAVALGRSRPGRRLGPVVRAVFFLALCAPFPLWWMIENARATGDALRPIHDIEKFHADWVKDGLVWLGPLRLRLMGLFFWPATLLLTVSPLAGFFAIAGMARAFVLRRRRALALLAIVPAGYFTFRAAVLMNFSPLARFTMAQVALSLFYVKDGFDWLCAGFSPRNRWATAGIAALVAAGTTVWLGHATAWREGWVAETLRPVGPLSTIPPEQMAAAAYLRETVGPDEAVVADEAPRYEDLNILHFSELPERRLVRRRWEDFEERLALTPSTRWLFVASGGALETREGVRAGESSITWRGRAYDRAASPSSRFFIYKERTAAARRDDPGLLENRPGW